MKNKFVILNCSVLALLVVVSPVADACAGVRVSNATRKNTQTSYFNQSAPQVGGVVQTPQQQPAVQQQPTTTQSSVQSAVSDIDMTNCQMIYPNGAFELTTPTLGTLANSAPTCTATVEMRTTGKMGETLVLARANVAAGDRFVCNISKFPTTSYTNEAYNFEFPADNPPTEEDVKQVMNQEQKQNAGFKIAATTLIGGMLGNMSGENDIGNDNVFGTDKGKIKNTIIGALGGAAIGAGGTYAGKVGGDMIMSTGINAAAGGVIGNVMATGGNILRVEKCKLLDGRESTCLIGTLQDGDSLTLGADKQAYVNLHNKNDAWVCDTGNPCKSERLIKIQLEGYPEKGNANQKHTLMEDFVPADVENITQSKITKYCLKTTKDGFVDYSNNSDCYGVDTGTVPVYYKIESAQVSTNVVRAMVEFEDDTLTGKTTDDWNKWKATNKKAKIYRIGTNNTAQELNEEQSSNENLLDSFSPNTISAEDGNIIDFNNKARTKSTLTGAGVGGAMGAFSGYQGAQEDIQTRLNTARRAYEDSLTTVYCITGTRFLSSYNDTVIIPSMP